MHAQVFRPSRIKCRVEITGATSWRRNVCCALHINRYVKTVEATWRCPSHAKLRRYNLVGGHRYQHIIAHFWSMLLPPSFPLVNSGVSRLPLVKCTSLRLRAKTQQNILNAALTNWSNVFNLNSYRNKRVKEVDSLTNCCSLGPLTIKRRALKLRKPL